MVKTTKMCHYHLRHDCDKDSICFEAQEHGCELLTGKGQIVVSMWETNPYNSFFALKYSKDFTWVKTEDWVL